MLKKLFKYEWNEVWKLLSILNVVVLMLSFLSGLAFSTEFMDQMSDNYYITMVFILYNILYFASILTLSISTNFYLLCRFYKNLYTDEGYLMHTLPVKSHELIWSKAFVGIIWQFISGIMIILSILIYTNNISMVSGNGTIWGEIGEMFTDLCSVDFTTYHIILLIIFILFILCAPLYNILLGYVSISLGQLSKKHKILASVGIYIGINYAMQAVSSFLTVPLTIGMSEVAEEAEVAYMTNVFGLSLLLIIGFGCLFYFLTNNIMKTKLNLE